MMLALRAAWRLASVALAGAVHLMIVGAIFAIPVGLIASLMQGIRVEIDLELAIGGAVLGGIIGLLVFTVIGILTLRTTEPEMATVAAMGGAVKYAMTATLGGGIIGMINGAAWQIFVDHPASTGISFSVQAHRLLTWWALGAALGFVAGAFIGAWRGAQRVLKMPPPLTGHEAAVAAFEAATAAREAVQQQAAT